MHESPTLNADNYLRLTFAALWRNLPLAILGGILFSVFCAPAFVFLVLDLHYAALIATILLVWPGWTMLLAFEAALLEERPVSLRLLFHKVHHFWMRSVRLGLVSALPALAWLWTAPLLTLREPPLVAWFGLIADGLGLLVVLTLALYAVPLMVLYDLALVPALRNSLVLASRHLGNTLGMVSMGVLTVLAVVYFSPALLFILPAVCGMFIVNNVRLVLAQEEQR